MLLTRERDEIEFRGILYLSNPRLWEELAAGLGEGVMIPRL